MNDKHCRRPLSAIRTKISLQTALETLQEMKQERLKLGLSLEQVAAEVGISSGLVRRLEAGEFERIGTAEIIQSAIRAYGAFLQTRQTCAAEAAMSADSQAANPGPSQASARPKRRRKLALSLLIIGALAAAIAVFFWRSSPPEERLRGAIMGQLSLAGEFGHGRSGRLADQPNFIRTQLAQQQQVASTASMEAPVAEAETDKTVQTAQHADQDRELPNQERPQGSGATTAAADNASGAFAAAAAEKEQRLLEARNSQLLAQHSRAELPQPSAGNPPAQAERRLEAGHTLELEATAECWIEVQIDGLKPLRELLKPGEQRTYRVNQKARLTLGNAGGVDIKWDGRSLSPAGKPGRVIRLTLPHAL